MTPRLLSASSPANDGVQNPQGEDLGSIKDLMINVDSGKTEYAVVEFGGFFGLGAKQFAIPYECFSVDTGKKAFILNASKEMLEKAEGFDGDKWPDFADNAWRKRTHSIFFPKP